MLLIAIIVAGLVIALVLLGRYDEGATDADWSAVTRGQANKTYRWIQAMIPAETKALLRAGHEQLLATSHDRVELVQGIEAYSRMLDAIRPVPVGFFKLFVLRLRLRRVRRILLRASQRANEGQIGLAQRELARLDAQLLESSRVLAVAPNAGRQS